MDFETQYIIFSLVITGVLAIAIYFDKKNKRKK